MMNLPLNLKVTLARDEDHTEIRSFIETVRGEFGIPIQAADTDLQAIEDHYQLRGGAILLVRDSKRRLLGTLGFTTVLPGEYEIRKFYLAPELRGRGVGRMLLEGVIALIASRGARSIGLESRSNLRAAAKLYRSVGFENLGRGTGHLFLHLELPANRLHAAG